MPVSALFLAALAAGAEQLVESRLGPAGVLAVALLTVGYQERDVTCGCVGAVMLALLALSAA